MVGNGAGGGSGLRVALVVEVARPTPYFVDAVRLLRSHGHDVTVVAVAGDEGFGGGVPETSASVVELGASSSRHYQRSARFLRRWCGAWKPDVLHVHEPIPLLVTRAAFGRRRPPVLLHRHHVAQHGLQRVFERVGGSVADRIVAVSRAAAEAAVADGVPATRLDVVYNGVPDLRPVPEEEVRALRESLQIPVGARVVAMVGRLRPRKGHDVLFEAHRRLRSLVNEELRLVVVGSGELEDQLRGQGADADIAFVGQAKDVAPYYALADVVAVPSLVEAFGLVAVEAMAAARPVVASGTGGLLEILAGEQVGLVVRPGDVDALAEALATVLRDQPLAHELAANGRRRYLEAFTTEVMVTGWEASYRELVSGRQKR